MTCSQDRAGTLTKLRQNRKQCGKMKIEVLKGGTTRISSHAFFEPTCPFRAYPCRVPQEFARHEMIYQ